MKFTLIIGDENQSREFSEEQTIKKVLEDLKFPLETVVVKKNGLIVIEEEKISDGDTIEVIKVIYGG